ncbi:uncharacterized protein [Linepithema humile]|uniref:uncharacterized protein n=1 Tax=Linepithema humile TaxID=83485 RepID=UPI00351F6603
MIINPLNVARLLLTSITTMYLMETPVNKAEIELKENIQKLILENIHQFNGLEVTEETSLDYEEPDKLHTFEIIEENEEAWNENNSNSHNWQCHDDDNFDVSYKRRAVEYWRQSDKENRPFKSVQHTFRRISSVRQLRRWEEQLEHGGNRLEKLSHISKATHDKFNVAVQTGLIIHDVDIKRWALEAQREIGDLDPVFQASPSWLLRFKKSHRIVSRKITKFITRKTLEDSHNIQREAENFVTVVKPLIERFGLENVYNTDQSGFQLEIHSGRSLSDQGMKTIDRVVQSVSSTTHSYTIQPTISCDGKLLSPLFIVLQEHSGTFGPRVQENLFRASNVIVTASKSGKMTSDHFKKWLEEAYFPNVGRDSVLLLDSWSGQCPAIVTDLTPMEKQVTTMVIPKGTTGKIQPLDVYGFRIWKNFARRFSDTVLLLNYDINLHQRNNIIKLQSLIHNQLSSPRYQNLFKYSWFKSGYTNERPETFKNPVEFSFEQTSSTCDIEDCNDIAVIQCSWCGKSLCLKHFFIEYHYCNIYNGCD